MKFLFVLFLSFFIFSNLFSQFDIENYKKYLISHKDMESSRLFEEFPTGSFLSKYSTDFLKSDYADSMISKYKLTNDEISLIMKNGFMVSERLSYPNFYLAFYNVYNNDLPVYISSDAILHTLHYNFDLILKEIESNYLYFQLDSLLSGIKGHFNQFIHPNIPIVEQAKKNLDIYISVAQYLLKGNTDLMYPDNKDKFNEIIAAIDELKPKDISIFTKKTVEIDFSQFTVRGHYTESPLLTNFFKALTWLSRVEIYLTKPKNELSIKISDEELQMNAITVQYLTEIIYKNKIKNYDNIETFLQFLLGKPDNITYDDVKIVLFRDLINNLIHEDVWKEFQEAILKYSNAHQLYNSQIMSSDLMDTNQVVPPTVFMLFGQRPIVDGYITANVVFDKILYKNRKIIRVMPSTYDLLFALGNDASSYFVKGQLDKYKYTSNLCALRYLVDAYDTTFWNSNTYNIWLNSIRKLNPPLDRSHLPGFMQTAAWWQKTMNTQLYSWAQLRYNFLLFAKQPYTMEYECSFPKSYVEPVPELYENMKLFYSNLRELNKNYLNSGEFKRFLDTTISTLDTLVQCSKKVLNNQEYNKAEIEFLGRMMKVTALCNPYTSMGWYPNMYYKFNETDEKHYKNGIYNEGDKYIVADVHTIPMDEHLERVGWVLHAGTGKVNMAIITTTTPDGKLTSFIGPVGSYYEFVSNDFKRLTNAEWREINGDFPAYRPSSTKLYLADREGKGAISDIMDLSFYTSSVRERDVQENIDINVRCYPNPFKQFTTMQFIIANNMSSTKTQLYIYDLGGNLIKTIVDNNLFPNNYTFIWDGTNDNNIKVSTGTYLYILKVGNLQKSGNITFAR